MHSLILRSLLHAPSTKHYQPTIFFLITNNMCLFYLSINVFEVWIHSFGRIHWILYEHKKQKKNVHKMNQFASYSTVYLLPLHFPPDRPHTHTHTAHSLRITHSHTAKPHSHSNHWIDKYIKQNDCLLKTHENNNRKCRAKIVLSFLMHDARRPTEQTQFI